MIIANGGGGGIYVKPILPEEPILPKPKYPLVSGQYTAPDPLAGATLSVEEAVAVLPKPQDPSEEKSVEIIEYAGVPSGGGGRGTTEPTYALPPTCPPGESLYRVSTTKGVEYVYAASRDAAKGLVGQPGFVTQVMSPAAYGEDQPYREVDTIGGQQVMVPYDPTKEAKVEFQKAVGYYPLSSQLTEKGTEFLQEIRAGLIAGTYVAPTVGDSEYLGAWAEQYGLSEQAAWMEARNVAERAYLISTDPGACGWMGLTPSQAQVAVAFYRTSGAPGDLARAEEIREAYATHYTPQGFPKRALEVGYGPFGYLEDYQLGEGFDLVAAIDSKPEGSEREAFVTELIPFFGAGIVGGALTRVALKTVVGSGSATVEVLGAAVVAGELTREQVREVYGDDAASRVDAHVEGLSGIRGVGAESGVPIAKVTWDPLGALWRWDIPIDPQTGKLRPAGPWGDWTVNVLGEVHHFTSKDEAVKWVKDKGYQVDMGVGTSLKMAGQTALGIAQTPEFMIGSAGVASFAGPMASLPGFLTRFVPSRLASVVGAVGQTRAGQIALQQVPRLLKTGYAIAGTGTALAGVGYVYPLGEGEVAPSDPLQAYLRGGGLQGEGIARITGQRAAEDLSREYEEKWVGSIGTDPITGEPSFTGTEEEYETYLEETEALEGQVKSAIRPWYSPVSLGVGFGTIFSPHSLVAETWEEKGPVSLTQLVPWYGATWAATGLRWDKLTSLQRGLGIGAGFLPHLAGPIGSGIGRLAGLSTRLPGVGPRILAPMGRGFQTVGRGVAQVTRPIDPYMPWTFPLELSRTAGLMGLAGVRGIGPTGSKWGWWESAPLKNVPRAEFGVSKEPYTQRHVDLAQSAGKTTRQVGILEDKLARLSSSKGPFDPETLSIQQQLVAARNAARVADEAFLNSLSNVKVSSRQLEFLEGLSGRQGLSNLVAEYSRILGKMEGALGAAERYPAGPSQGTLDFMGRELPRAAQLTKAGLLRTRLDTLGGRISGLLQPRFPEPLSPTPFMPGPAKVVVPTISAVDPWTGLYSKRPARVTGWTPEGTPMYEGGPAPGIDAGARIFSMPKSPAPSQLLVRFPSFPGQKMVGPVTIPGKGPSLSFKLSYYPDVSSPIHPITGTAPMVRVYGEMGGGPGTLIPEQFRLDPSSLYRPGYPTNVFGDLRWAPPSNIIPLRPLWFGGSPSGGTVPIAGTPPITGGSAVGGPSVATMTQAGVLRQLESLGVITRAVYQPPIVLPFGTTSPVLPVTFPSIPSPFTTPIPSPFTIPITKPFVTPFPGPFVAPVTRPFITPFTIPIIKPPFTAPIAKPFITPFTMPFTTPFPGISNVPGTSLIPGVDFAPVSATALDPTIGIGTSPGLFTPVTTPVTPVGPVVSTPIPPGEPPPPRFNIPPIVPPFFGWPKPRKGVPLVKKLKGLLGIGAWKFTGFQVSGPHPLLLGTTGYTWMEGEEIPYGTGKRQPKVGRKRSPPSEGLVRVF